MNKKLYITNTNDAGERLVGVLEGEQVFSLEILPEGPKVPLSELLRFTAGSLDFQPNQCIFVTDKTEGIRAAKEAGMQIETNISTVANVMDAA